MPDPLIADRELKTKLTASCILMHRSTLGVLQCTLVLSLYPVPFALLFAHLLADPGPGRCVAYTPYRIEGSSHFCFITGGL